MSNGLFLLSIGAVLGVLVIALIDNRRPPEGKR